MNSFFFQADSSCPVPRPAPELLEIVVKQREGNQNWRAKYIVATKVTRQDKFRQRPHHAVMSCARVWLGEIHTLTAPDGSAKWYDSDGEEESYAVPIEKATLAQQQQSQMSKKMKKEGADAPMLKTNAAGGLPTVSPAVAGAAAAAVAAASAAAANEAAAAATQAQQASATTPPAASSSSAAPSSSAAAQPAPATGSNSAGVDTSLPALPTPTGSQGAQQQGQQAGVQQSMQQGGLNLPHLSAPGMGGLPGSMFPGMMGLNMGMQMNMPMSYPASIAPYMPLLHGVLTPSPMGAPQAPLLPRTKNLNGKRLPVLPDLLICLRPIEEWGPNRAPIFFVQTHGGQEYLLIKHGATFVIDVAPEHEVLSVRISMKNEKPKTLKVWKFENSVQRPAVGQGQVDLEDISRSIPAGLNVPVVYPPGSGDSPFHVLHIDKELHPTVPTVVLHQLHEPQHLHTEQTFYITPLNKAQRRVRKILQPPPPSKPSASKQQQIQSAAAGVISAIATGGNVSEASQTLAATKAKKRAIKKKPSDDPLSLLMGQVPMAGASGAEDDDESEDEPAGLDGLGRKRKRRSIPPSVAARLRGGGAHLGLGGGTHPMLGSMLDFDPQSALGLAGGEGGMPPYPMLEEEEVTDDEDEEGAAKQEDAAAAAGGEGEEGKSKRRRKKARLMSDVNLVPSPQLQAFINAHDGKWLTAAVRACWEEMKRHPNFQLQAYSKEQAEEYAKRQAERDGLSPDKIPGLEPQVIPLSGQLPSYLQIQLDWEKLAKDLGENVSPDDLAALWKFAGEALYTRRQVDLDDLDLRSLWQKPEDMADRKSVV